MICRYYEGQLTDLSEVDAEEEEKKERGKVTEAAEKVLYPSYNYAYAFPHLLIHVRCGVEVVCF